jgi:hypothetical protein
MTTSHPYATQPDHAFWRQAVAAPAATDPAALDPVVRAAFRIGPDERIATAGSCFAQHVTRHLRLAGHEPFVTEAAHPVIPAALARSFGYGEFGARYGNIYTSRQLLQLMLRAFGEFVPQEPPWRDAAGGWIDPFRPRVQPGGFVSRAELESDRKLHFDAVRRLFAEVDVFVFTLGLTETWAARADAAVFPVCPGVVAGSFDPDRHVFLNLGVDEVCADMDRFIGLLAAINPRCRVVLTVSPVPLVATAGQDHVLVASSLSKAVLRVAAERLARQWSGVAYFPSYEIITGSFHRGAYLADDLRSVTEAGVAHVMRLFLHHYLGQDVPAPAAAATAHQPAALDQAARAQCDEEALAR